jgi:hypothetical protein
MSTLELNGKDFATQTSSAEPVLASTVTGGAGLSGSTSLGTVTVGTINSTVTLASHDNIVKAWGRIEDNVLTSNHGISGITTSGAGSNARYYTITMSPAMANDDYAVVTNGYSHEGGQVEGTVQWYTGNVTGTPSTTQFAIRFAGNGGSHINVIGFAVFGT